LEWVAVFPIMTRVFSSPSFVDILAFFEGPWLGEQ